MPFSFFYVAVSVFPNDGPNGDCIYSDAWTTEKMTYSMMQAPVNYQPTAFSGNRVKNITITVEPSLNSKLPHLTIYCILYVYIYTCIYSLCSASQYVMAIGVLLALMLTFYLVSFIGITVFEWYQ